MRLNEIEYLRPILFIQLFFTHAFTIYTISSWKLPVGIEQIELYGWIGRISYSSMLELFTFISGYVYYFVAQKKQQSFVLLLMNKLQRLMLPSILFSILYYVLLMTHQPIGWKLMYEIICGEGHLWYLPMLFGCFLIAYFIKDKKNIFCILIVTMVASSFSRMPNVFRISQIVYYFFFFYLGICLCRYRMAILHYMQSRKKKS